MITTLETVRVADFMTTDLTTFRDDMEINEAMVVLLDQRLSGAPVLDIHGQLVGVLSKKDCLRAAFTSVYHRTLQKTVADYMTRDVETLSAEASIFDAIEKFIAGPYRRFPVLHHHRLVGQVSRSDALGAIVDMWGRQ